MTVDSALGCLTFLLACAYVRHPVSEGRAVRRRRLAGRRVDRRVRG